MYCPLAPVIWRCMRSRASLIVKVTFAASSVSIRCNLINSNCCPHITGIQHPAHCWTNMYSRLILWGRTVKGGCDIPDNFYVRTYSCQLRNGEIMFYSGYPCTMCYGDVLKTSFIWEKMVRHGRTGHTASCGLVKWCRMLGHENERGTYIK